MVVRNKLDKVFGPFGSSTGFFMLIGGIIATYYSFTGLIIILIGAFISFTTTSTHIDFENKKIRFSNNLFGIIPVGKWFSIEPDMKIGVKKSHRGYRAYIRGNQPIDIHNNDFRLFLYSFDNKQIMPIQKFNSYIIAKAAQIELCSNLGLNNPE